MTISEDEHKKFLDSIFKEIEQNEKVINKILSRKKNGKKEKSDGSKTHERIRKDGSKGSWKAYGWRESFVKRKEG